MSKKENQTRTRLDLLGMLIVAFGIIPLAIILTISYLGPRLPLSSIALQSATETQLVETSFSPDATLETTPVFISSEIITPLPDVTVSHLDSYLIVDGTRELPYVNFLGWTFGVQPFQTDWQWQVVSYTSGLVQLPSMEGLPPSFIFQAVTLGPNQIVLVSDGVPCDTPMPSAEASKSCSPIPVKVVVNIQVDSVPPTIPPEPTYTPFPMPDADIVMDGSKLRGIVEPQTLNMLVGQTLAILRPDENHVWGIAGYQEDFIEILSSPDKMRDAGPEGWLFRAVAHGSTSIYLAGRDFPCATRPAYFTPLPSGVLPTQCNQLPDWVVEIKVEILDPSFTPEP